MKNRLSLSISVILLSIICLLTFSASAAQQTADLKSVSTTLTGVVQNGSDITVKWKAVDCSGYILRFATKPDFSNCREINIENGKKSSYIIGNRDKNAVYYVQVRPYTTVDEVDYYGEQSIARYTDKVTGLRYTSNSDSITLSWNKNNRADGYQIVEYNSSMNSYKSVMHISANSTSYKIKNLKSNSVYKYNVRPYVKFGSNYCYGSYVSDLKAITDAANTTLTSVVQNGSDITVRWKAVDCAGYVLRFATKSDFSNGKEINIANPKASSYVITNRDKNASYFVQIRPYVVLDGKTYYNTQCVPRYTAKTSGLKFKNESNAITLSWNKKSGASGYQIVEYNSATKSYKSVVHVSAKTTSYRISGLKSSTLYKYNVRPYIKIGNNYCYGCYTADLQTRTKSANTSIVSAVQNGSNINVKWYPVQGSGYVLRFATKADFSNAKEIYINDSRTYTYVITKRNPNASYYVQVKPFTTLNGNRYYSDYSAPVSTAPELKLLVSYSSNYVNNANRTTNLRLAANAINGTVVKPGETFSFNEVVGVRTAEKGYKQAPVFAGDRTENGIGGGICQIASTMFNTALMGNMQIVERHQHSQRVAYVPLGRDAAIFWGSQDLKWKNTTDYPITIKMTVSNGVATCAFYSNQAAKVPSGVKLSVAQSGKKFTLRRYVNGINNYTTYSTY